MINGQMVITKWGQYPKIKAIVKEARNYDDVGRYIETFESVIARGLGRCLGDSSLSKNIISPLKLNRIIRFDEKEGTVRCEAGVSLKEILDIFVPRGWFLPVTPGTKFVTIGGAIASDVHGKNHHKEGSFSDHVNSLDVLIPNGEIVTCSKNENNDLFKATCGGMGLTGVILNATFCLKKIETAYIKQLTIKAKNIDEIVELFDEYAYFTYSVAWIDCLTKGKFSGRSILMLGEHARIEDINDVEIKRNPLFINERKKVNVSFRFPAFALNSYTVKSFNFLYYNSHFRSIHESVIDYDRFFFPLDSIYNWNRIYGSRGYTQYQFVLPKEVGKKGLKEILGKISDEGKGSFLAVLKLFGKENENFISFPMEGYTLALDFPIKENLFGFFDKLDDIVKDYGGRLYLTKDVRMSEKMFKKSYKKSEDFINFKSKIDKKNKIQSLQSRRIGI
jgi:FAD/FMN-containing dehydrogenase